MNLRVTGYFFYSGKRVQEKRARAPKDVFSVGFFKSLQEEWGAMWWPLNASLKLASTAYSRARAKCNKHPGPRPGASLF